MPSPYELQRQRVKTDTNARSTQENEALKRRFARMGGLQSGSYVKAQERLAGQQEQNQQRALESVDVQESLAEEQKAEAERGRQFARSERLGSQDFANTQRLGSQDFASIEALKGREFARGERLSSQDFAALEAEKGRKFTTGEREAMQRYATGEREAGQTFARGEREAGQTFARGERIGSQEFAAKESSLARGQQESQFMRQMGLALKQYGLDEEVSRFNMDMANKIFNQKDFFERTFDPMGFTDSKGAGSKSIFDPLGATPKVFGRRG